MAMFDSGVFGFLPICASKGEIFLTPCGVILSVFFLRHSKLAYMVYLIGIFSLALIYV